MKRTRHDDDPILSFCKATSECRETAMFYLEGFSGDLDSAISGFLQGRLPPIKKTLPFRFRSRSPTITSVSESKNKNKIVADEISICWTSSYTDFSTSLEDITLPKNVTHGEDIVSIPVAATTDDDHVNDQEFEEEGSVRLANDSTSIEISLPFPDRDSDSD